MQSIFPEVENLVRVQQYSNADVEYNNIEIPNNQLLFTDKDFFNIFSFPLKEGNKNDVLINKNSIVITEAFAKKINIQNPIGKHINISINNKTCEVMVTGIAKKFPSNSSIKADAFVPIKLYLDILEEADDYKHIRSDWSMTYFTSFIKLPKDYTLNNMVLKLKSLQRKYQTKGLNHRYSIQNVNDMYLYSTDLVNSNWKEGNLEVIKILALIGILLLLIPCLNYIIFSSSRAIQELKGIGIKKINGALNKDILSSVLIEGALFIGITFIISIIVFINLLPYVNNKFDQNLAFNFSGNWQFFIGLLIILIFIIYFSNLYLIAIFSRYKPINLIKNEFQKGKTGDLIRKILLGIQFIIFTAIIFYSFAVYQQVKFAKLNLGFETKNIVNLLYLNDFKTYYSEFRHKLMQNPNIINVGSTTISPPANDMLVTALPIVGEPDKRAVIEWLLVDENFIDILNFEFVKGNGFIKEKSMNRNKYILNESALKKLNIESPIGYSLPGGDVIGIIKDFHMHDVYEEIKPLLISYSDEAIGELVIKIKQQNINETINY